MQTDAATWECRVSESFGPDQRIKELHYQPGALAHF
jgi:hypothetical protein